MTDFDDSSAVEKTPDPTGRKVPLLLSYFVSTLMALPNLCGSAWIVFMAVQSVRWHRAENLAALGLLFFGVPAFLVQVVVFLPITYFAINSKNRRDPADAGFWLVWSAVLFPVVTGIAIATGICAAGGPGR